MSRYADPSNAIHKIDEEKQEYESSRTCLSYTIVGKEEYLDDDGYPRIDKEEDINVHAKLIHTKHEHTETTRFLAKCNKRGRLFNPLGLYDEGKTLRRKRHAGKDEWSFREVSQKVFANYIDFLKSKNLSYLHIADREVL